jgi:hypothetical protein
MQEGFIARLARGIGDVVSGGEAASWFGPQAPLPPAAPADVAGRQFDYPFGFNLAITPRNHEPTGFAELRGLADSYDLLRCVIETRKDQVERLTWHIRKRSGFATHASDAPRIAALAAFFARPDRLHAWPTWLRMLLEDLLVIDAPALYLRRTRGGALWALEILDGATIKRLIDPWGRTPAAPAPAYQQILKGVPAVDYTAEELIYAPRNCRAHKAYGFSPVEQVQMSVNIALRRQIYQLQYYTEGNIPEALIGVPDSWNPDQIRQFQSYWDALNAGDTAERRHAKFVPGGVAKTFIPTREPVMKDVFDEWLARVICFAFSIPPSALVAQVNRATAETAQDTALSEGLAPLQLWVKHLVDQVIVTEFQAPDLEFAWDEDRAVDPSEVARIAASYVAARIKSVNEVRAELGLAPVPGGDLPAGPSAPSGTDAAASDAPGADKLLRFNSNHYGPGERGGQFAPKGEGGGEAPVQVAGGSESDSGSGRDRDAIEEEFVDPAAPIRQERFIAARDKLRAIDPTNPAIPSLHGPDWVPNKDDVNGMQDALDRAIEERAADVANHAYEKHVRDSGEFPEIHSEIELQLLAQDVMKRSQPETARNGHILFYRSSTNTLVVINPDRPEVSTIFRPPEKREYVNRILKGSR